MFKTFSAAILAAVAIARGKNDGTSQDNAMEMQLIDDAAVSMTIYSYNSDNAGTQEIHGDLEIATKGNGWYENIVFGFCIGQETAGWDCLRAEAGVNADEIASDSIYASSFLTRDFFAETATISALGDMQVDATALEENAAKSWVPIADKSSKACAKVTATADGMIVKCSKVNVHYMRNFTTDNADQDVQLSLDKAGTKHKIMGFFADFKDAKNTKKGLVAPVLGAVNANYTPVKSAHKAAVELAANEGGGSGSGSDGSISMAVTAVAAALYAMAF